MKYANTNFTVTQGPRFLKIYQIIQPVAKMMFYSPQIDNKDPLLKTTPLQLIEQGEVKVVLSRAFMRPFNSFSKGKYSAGYQKRNINTKLRN